MIDRTQIFSPIHRIPSELLLEFFRLRIDEDQRLPSYTSTDLSLGAWPLAQVCGGWRSVVTSTQQFWSHIQLDVSVHPLDGSQNARSPEVTLRLLRLQLERCQDLPLIIRLHLPFRTRAWDAQVDAVMHGIYDSLARMIAPSHLRWKELEIYNKGDWCLYETLLDIVKAPIACPLLELLRLEGPVQGVDADPHVRSLLISHGAPALSTAFFRNCFPRIIFPWSQLQQLKLLNIDESIIPTLHELINLRKLSITQHIGWNVSSSEPYILLPKLENLLCRAPELLSIIRTPVLKVLDVGLEDLDPIIALIKRSQCSLYGLSIHPHDPERLLAFLEVMQELRELNISFDQFLCGETSEEECYNLFKALFEHGQDGSFTYCPRLSSFTTRWKYDIDPNEDFSLVVDLLEQRWFYHQQGDPEHNGRLKTVELEVDDSTTAYKGYDTLALSDEQKHRLKALRDEGMNLRLVGFSNVD